MNKKIMKTYVDNTQESKSQPAANSVARGVSGGPTFEFTDNRPEGVAQRQLQNVVNSSSQSQKITRLQKITDNYYIGQRRFVQKKENDTGKFGIKKFSGFIMDNVKEYQTSGKLVQLNAHTYTQEAIIRLNPVQKKQEKAAPSRQMKDKVINDVDLQPQQIQKQENNQEPALNSVLIVEDSSNPSSGQMTKSEFLRHLYQEIYKVGLEVYNGTNLTIEGCPFIARWFARYSKEDVSHIEAAIRKYVSIQMAVTAQELIQRVCERARKGFEKQVKTGLISELPDDLSEQDGQGIVPEPGMVVQEKPIQRVSFENGERNNVIQRGCLRAGAAGAAAPATLVIRDGDNPNWQFVAAGNTTILQTSPMGDCWALIIVTPGGGRILAHLPGGDVDQLNGGGIAAINAHIVAGSVVTIVRGVANASNSATINNLIYGKLGALAAPAGPAQTVAGFFAHASVDAAGNVNTW
ncbi:MAG: hypothetical protein ACFB2Y_06110 [Fulvivirga sp.]